MIDVLWIATHTGMPSVVLDPIAPAAAWRLTGSHLGYSPGRVEPTSWVVAGGLGQGLPVAVSDPAAPLGIETTYTLEIDGEVVDTAAITRSVPEAPGVRCPDTLVMSADGRHHFVTTWSGDTSMSWEPGASYHRPLRSRHPVQYRPLEPGGPSWSFEGHAAPEQVGRARAALDRGRVWVLHDRTVGNNPYSEVPAVMLAGIGGAVSEKFSGAGRNYSATFHELGVTENEPTGVAVITWGEARAFGAVWSGTIPTTFTYLRQQIAGQP